MTVDGTALELRLLGPPEVAWAGRPLDLRARKPLALVLALAVRADGLSKETLAELLWGPGRRANLRSALYQLRRDVGAEGWLEEDAASDRLRLHADSDLARFERRLSAGDAAGALAAWPAASLASGPRTALLAGFDVPGAPAFHDWLDGERERLFARLRDAAVIHADALAATGASEAALALLEAVSDDDPYDEELQRRIMTLAWRAGDPERALRRYEACRRALAEGLGLAPVASTRDLYEAIREDAPGVAAPPPARLPAHGGDELPFVGRRRERELLRGLLGEHRWVTLVGPGGVGKTRLARTVAEEVRGGGDPAVVFVPLDAVHGTEFAVAAIANAVHVAFDGPERPVVQLAAALRGRRTLLVLDNAEHLQPRLGDALAQLLEAAPEVRLLTTSRVASERPGERIVRIDGLDAPDGPDDPGLVDRDAVRLFVAAAARARPSFRLDDATRRDVARICVRLRGHPLGLRLAAGWLRFRSCAEVADALDVDPLDLDNPGVAVEARHAGLRQVLESSWALLEPVDQRRLAKLSVFRGTFDAEAARAVADADARATAALVSAAWLHPAGAGRFDLHPSIREFGHQRLRVGPDGDEVEARHARLYLGRLAGRLGAILGPEPRDALDATEREWENLRAAWSFAARAGWDDALHAAAEPLSLYADMRVRFLEAERMFEEALGALGEGGGSTAARVALSAGLGTHLFRQSRYGETLAVAERTLALAERSPDAAPDVLHRARKLRGDALSGASRYQEALEAYRAALRLSREALPDRVSRDLRSLANAEACLGRNDDAERHYRAAIALDRDEGYRVGLAIDLNNLAELLITQDRLDEAEAMIAESLAIAEGVDVHLVPYLELNLAELAERRGDPAATVLHAERCAALAERFGQAALRSRAATRLGAAALAAGERDEAARHLGRALRIAWEAREGAAALHALVERGRLARLENDDALATRCLRVVATHAGAEARDARLAAELLGDAAASPGPSEAPLEPLLAELVAAAPGAPDRRGA